MKAVTDIPKGQPTPFVFGEMDLPNYPSQPVRVYRRKPVSEWLRDAEILVSDSASTATITVSQVFPQPSIPVFIDVQPDYPLGLVEAQVPQIEQAPGGEQWSKLETELDEENLDLRCFPQPIVSFGAISDRVTLSESAAAFLRRSRGRLLSIEGGDTEEEMG
jgi:hypothetical protein